VLKCINMPDKEVKKICANCISFSIDTTPWQDESKKLRVELAEALEEKAVEQLDSDVYKLLKMLAGYTQELGAYGDRHCGGRVYGGYSNSLCQTGQFKPRN